MGHLFEKRKICHGCYGNYHSVGKRRKREEKKCPAVTQAELAADFLAAPSQSQTTTSALPLLLSTCWLPLLLITPFLLSILNWIFIFFAQLWRNEMRYHVAELVWLVFLPPIRDGDILFPYTDAHSHKYYYLGYKGAYKTIYFLLWSLFKN